MCTLIVLRRIHPEFPVVIAGNRDEMTAREATAPRLLRADPPIVGGLDVVGGGTWLGVTPSGVLAAITNQRSWHMPSPAPRSRGQVVLRVLEAASRAGPGDPLGAAKRALEAMDPSAQNSFNLLVADAKGAFVAYARREEESLDIEDVPAGITVLANDRIGSKYFPKQTRAKTLIEPFAKEPWEALRSHLARTLSDHVSPPPESIEPPPPGARFSRELAARLQAICIHTEGYGTRSATIAALRPEGVAHYLFADGPPCQATFEDFTPCLAPTRR